MKRMMALLLCCAMVLTLCAGCKKDTTTLNKELTDSIIASDLASNYAKYSFSHVAPETKPVISDLQVSQRTEEGDVTKLAVTAEADTGYATIQVAAKMEYTWEINYWRMSHMEVTDATVTPTAVPSMSSVQLELSNYISVAGSALAILDGTHHNLTFAPSKAMWGIVWDAATKTAKLSVTATTTEFTFEGYYNLTFTDTGWVFETEKQESGQNYPLMHLTKLNKVVTKK